MIKYILQQIKGLKEVPNAHGKWIARAVTEETLDLDQLARHMSNHNSPFSKGAIKGILIDMVACIKELLLEGKNVKIDDLAIFSVSIENKDMPDNVDTFNVQKNVEAVRMKALATGSLSKKVLNLDAMLQEKGSYVSPRTDETPASKADNGNSGKDNTDLKPADGTNGQSEATNPTDSGNDSENPLNPAN